MKAPPDQVDRQREYRRRHPAPPPVVHEKPAWPTVLSRTAGRNGLYFYNFPGGTSEDEWIKRALQHNLWVTILVNETDRTPIRDGKPIAEAEIFALRDRLIHAGVTTVASGWADPALDLDSQAAMIGHMSQGFHEYMLNIEFNWTWPGPYDQPPPPGWNANAVFAPKVRQQIGHLPLSVCLDWGNILHFRPWLEAGTSAFRVQCYMNEWPHKNPRQAMAMLGQMQSDLPGGVPASMREVVYGRYSNDKELESWTAQDDEAGRPPRSAWAAEFCNTADVAWLAR